MNQNDWKITLAKKGFAIFTWSDDTESLINYLARQNLVSIPTTKGIISKNIDAQDPYDWNHNNKDFYFHQDGSHLDIKPKYVALHCGHPGQTNVSTALTDARSIYENLVQAFPMEFLHSLIGVYINKHGQVFKRPLVEEADRKYINAFHYLEPDTTLLDNKHRMIFNQLLQKLLQKIHLLQTKHVIYEHVWQKDEVLLFENRPLHHARVNRSGSEDTERQLARTWFN